ncbi:rCG56315 [Rattus norvegicus]|uniref:RCG56315 n=1 Tax=Rattus norvegicus TaxID=10116 RepID=A6IAI2_RAT|nr:rCG56315 [Rattus norvegicus]
MRDRAERVFFKGVVSHLVDHAQGESSTPRGMWAAQIGPHRLFKNTKDREHMGSGANLRGGKENTGEWI